MAVTWQKLYRQKIRNEPLQRQTESPAVVENWCRKEELYGLLHGYDEQS